jgi:DNA-binding transcriptional ArsR family regulator
VESVFEIVAEPNRRAVVGLLVSSQQSVGEIERQLHTPQPTVSKHLRVLRALERHLDRMDQTTPTKKKGKEKTTRLNRERDKGEKK